jgi:hypothetical protein
MMLRCFKSLCRQRCCWSEDYCRENGRWKYVSYFLDERSYVTKLLTIEHWIINGTKKWITNGTFADYFTVGCRTDGGFTVILVERGEGVETMPIKT